MPGGRGSQPRYHTGLFRLVGHPVGRDDQDGHREHEEHDRPDPDGREPSCLLPDGRFALVRPARTISPSRISITTTSSRRARSAPSCVSASRAEPGPACAGPPADDEAKEKAGVEVLKTAYESLCIYILRFLDAELKGDEAGKEFVETRYRDTPLADASPHVEYVAPAHRPVPLRRELLPAPDTASTAVLPPRERERCDHRRAQAIPEG